MKKWLLLPVILSILFAIGLFAIFMLIPLFMIGGGQQASAGTGSWGAGTISQIAENEIPAEFIPIYKAAEEKYGVPWNLLAAVHRIETRFSTLKPMISKVGAEGHMQFMPCTFVGWGAPGCKGTNGKGHFSDEEKTSLALIQKYGGDGVDADGDGKADMWNVKDAIFSAAHYLAANGAANGEYEKAVFTYNQSQEYVAEVMKYATLYVQDGYKPIETVEPGKGGFARPVEGPVTSPFGPRVHPITGQVGKPHKGVDIGCPKGTSIQAAKAGKVTFAGWQDASNPKKGYGQFIWIDHGGGYRTTYGHLSAIEVSVGQDIQIGQEIGKCGSTGGSTGPHLHFEIAINGTHVNPAPYIGLK
ncbi:peptidoglycan DD-metalloendopeptidase family protein (plasmid) [Paenibacillus peoriae]|uniref:peptidoglycan DD-metalloendopeptidase family protein n=1 Tax=Paenibacillus peoriae TaxID=59893 RepID=UPI0032AEFE14